MARPRTHQLGTNPHGLKNGIWGQGSGDRTSPVTHLQTAQVAGSQGGAGRRRGMVYISGPEAETQSDCPELSICEDEGSDIIGIGPPAEPGK